MKQNLDPHSEALLQQYRELRPILEPLAKEAYDLLRRTLREQGIWSLFRRPWTRCSATSCRNSTWRRSCPTHRNTSCPQSCRQRLLQDCHHCQYMRSAPPLSLRSKLRLPFSIDTFCHHIVYSFLFYVLIDGTKVQILFQMSILNLLFFLFLHD